MEESRNELLYKFSRVSKYSLDALKDGYAWFSRMSELNDPFEGQVNLIGKHSVINRKIAIEWFEALEEVKYSNKKHHAKLDVIIKELYEILIQSIKYQTEESCILSLSQCDERSDPIRNRLMWSHYADEMKGFCIEFFPGLFRSLSDKNESSHIIPVKTDYVSTQREIDIGKLHPGGESSREIIMEMLKNKHEDWRYENEVRFASHNHGKHYYSHNTIKTIYLGGRMPESQKEEIVGILKDANPSIQVKYATVGSRYEIVIK